MKNKKQIVMLAVLAVLVVALIGVYFVTRPGAVAGPKEFTLVIVHKDGQSSEQTYVTREEYLGAYLEAEGIIKGAEGPYGVYIHSVEGEKAVYEEDNAYWAFYEGEDYANLGVDQTPIQHDAVYKLIYTDASDF